MSKIEYLKADENDYENLVDLIDLVFSRGYPHNFEELLPAQYSRNNFMSGTNYIVKENGKIVANVGAYPVDYNICGKSLRISGITSVAVHPRTRSKGYMKILMETALEDMRKDATDLSFLNGARQRYEYFGFTPCGIRYEYYCDKYNIDHFFGKEHKANIVLKEAEKQDIEIFDKISDLYNTGNAYIKRPGERFVEIMNTWENKTLAIYNDDLFIGYLSCDKNQSSICELKIDGMDFLCDVIKAYMEHYRRNDVTFTAYPFETEFNAALSAFAGSVSIHNDGNYNVLNYPNVLNSFLELKCKNCKIPDGAITFSIRDVGNISISVSNNLPSVFFTDENSDIILTQMEATRLFFSPYSAFSLGLLDGNAFARCLFPIPLFIRRLDRS